MGTSTRTTQNRFSIVSGVLFKRSIDIYMKMRNSNEDCTILGNIYIFCIGHSFFSEQCIYPTWIYSDSSEKTMTYPSHDRPQHYSKKHDTSKWKNNLCSSTKQFRHSTRGTLADALEFARPVNTATMCTREVANIITFGCTIWA